MAQEKGSRESKKDRRNSKTSLRDEEAPVVSNNRTKSIKRQFFSMSRICNEKCSKPKIFLAFLSKLLCFSFIL